jgi:hypothetical protein
MWAVLVRLHYMVVQFIARIERWLVLMPQRGKRAASILKGIWKEHPGSSTIGIPLGSVSTVPSDRLINTLLAAIFSGISGGEITGFFGHTLPSISSAPSSSTISSEFCHIPDKIRSKRQIHNIS